MAVSQDHAPAITAVTSGQSHTPGRWRDGNEALRTAAHATAIWNGTVLSSSGKLVALSFGHTPEECADLARLIAAAPELLEALEAMVAEKADYMRLNHLGDPEAQHTVKLARAAIAKATGGSNAR